MTGRTRIKICGMTELYEVEQAVGFGVDAVGFIFASKSPRYIDPEQARDIIRQLPAFVDAVGVFVNEDPARVNEIVSFCGLSLAQLHGHEPPEYCQLITSRVVKAFQVRNEPDEDVLADYQKVTSAFLLDTYHKEMAGGTGQTFDWQLVQMYQGFTPLILAGGLSVDNVAAAINEVRPFAVDVNSTLESSPGRKDVAKIEALVSAVRQADATA